jgi:hypothetical protein
MRVGISIALMIDQPSSRAWRESVDSPTNDRVRRWMRHFALIRETSIERWIEPLALASVPSFVHPITSELRDLLVDQHWRRETGLAQHPLEVFDAIVDVLEEGVLEACQHSDVGAAFVRTGSRSPIDSALAIEGALQVDGGTEALEVLLQSRRVFDDLCLAQECGHAPTLVLRPWLELAPWAELRAAIVGRRLVALTARHLPDGSPAMNGRERALARAARRRCAELEALWPLDDVVVDFVVADGDALILDIGPLVPDVDPVAARLLARGLVLT